MTSRDGHQQRLLTGVERFSVTLDGRLVTLVVEAAHRGRDRLVRRMSFTRKIYLRNG